MKSLALFVVLFSLSALAASPTLKRSPAHAPITSKEDVQFLAKSEDEILFFGKIPEFVGIFERTYEKNPDLQIVELFTFPTIRATKMDPIACQQMAEKIFNPKHQEYLKLQAPQFKIAPMGKTCEVHVQDTSSWAKFKEKYMIAGFLKGKPYALLFKIEKNSTTQIEETARTFWDSLR